VHTLSNTGAANLLLKETRRWMDSHTLVVLCGFVRIPRLGQAGRMVEEARSNSLANGDVVTRIRDRVNFNSLQEAKELIPHIMSALHRAMLEEIFVAPLDRVSRFHPLVPDIQQRHMVSAWPEEVLPGVVRVNDFVLWTEEDRVVDAEHPANGDDFLRALVCFRGQDHLGEHRV